MKNTDKSELFLCVGIIGLLALIGIAIWIFDSGWPAIILLVGWLVLAFRNHDDTLEGSDL